MLWIRADSDLVNNNNGLAWSEVNNYQPNLNNDAAAIAPADSLNSLWVGYGANKSETASGNIVRFNWNNGQIPFPGAPVMGVGGSTNLLNPPVYNATFFTAVPTTIAGSQQTRRYFTGEEESCLFRCADNPPP